MSRAHRTFIGTLLAAAMLVSGACSGPAPKAERCAEVKADLAACIGTSAARLDCDLVTDADLERIHVAAQSTACALMAEALPLDGDPRSATCRLLGVGCVAPVTPKVEHVPTQYPVLLVNGIDTSPLFRYSPRIVDTLVKTGGHRVYLATLTPYEAPRRRAPELWARIQQVRAETGARKVNLVCHSLGGLDCRYLVSPGGLAADTGEGGMAEAVASITTVGTAHRGTRVADVILGVAPDGSDDRSKVVNDFATLAGDWFSEKALAQDVHLRDALAALSVSAAPAFNAEIVDALGIYYQSFAGFSRPFGNATGDHDAMLRDACRSDDEAATAAIVGATVNGLPGFVRHDFMALTLAPFTDIAGKMGQRQGVPNDGLTPVPSAKWGSFRGCVPADHMEQLGQRNLPDANVQNGFDVARFYGNVAADLARRGF